MCGGELRGVYRCGGEKKRKKKEKKKKKKETCMDETK